LVVLALPIVPAFLVTWFIPGLDCSEPVCRVWILGLWSLIVLSVAAFGVAAAVEDKKEPWFRLAVGTALLLEAGWYALFALVQWGL